MNIIINTNFEGIHHWPDAPEQYGYLRNPHRHMFFVNVIIPTDTSRQIEFIDAKHFVDETIPKLTVEPPYINDIRNYGAKSCETIAEQLIDHISRKWGIKQGIRVKVLEDNENGAEVSI